MLDCVYSFHFFHHFRATKLNPHEALAHDLSLKTEFDNILHAHGSAAAQQNRYATEGGAGGFVVHCSGY